MAGFTDRPSLSRHSAFPPSRSKRTIFVASLPPFCAALPYGALITTSRVPEVTRMLGYDFMLLQMAPFIQDNVINKITQGFVVRDSLLHGVGMDDLAKAADGLAALEQQHFGKGDEDRIEQGMFSVHEISRKFSLHGVMTPS